MLRTTPPSVPAHDRSPRRPARSLRIRRTLGVRHVARDTQPELTRRLQELERFRLGVEHTGEHIVFTDADGMIIYANDAAERITGYTRGEMLGKKAGSKELWGGLMDTTFYQELWRVISIEKRHFRGRITNRRKDGREYVAESIISPVLDHAGNVQFYVGVERDVTREVEIDRAKSEFVSLASHQLRTPLSAVNWYAEMLLAGDLGALEKDQREFVQTIYDSNKRMVELVNALLNVSRIDLGTLSIEPVPTDLRTVMTSVLDELKPLVLGKRLTVTITGDPLPLIPLDQRLIRIVVQNLLTNAAKYTPEGGCITLRMHASPTDVRVDVSDTGYGIPQHEQEKIFTKLFRGSNVVGKVTDGTGLGLYIVKNILETSGGSIRFTSVEGSGTTFTFTIPRTGMRVQQGTNTLTGSAETSPLSRRTPNAS